MCFHSQVLKRRFQNNVEELFSFFHFLRAKPLDDWHVFKERISSLIKDGRTKMAMKRLHVVLKAIMLRRTKDAMIGVSSLFRACN